MHPPVYKSQSSNLESADHGECNRAQLCFPPSFRVLAAQDALFNSPLLALRDLHFPELTGTLLNRLICATGANYILDSNLPLGALSNVVVPPVVINKEPLARLKDENHHLPNAPEPS